MYFDVGFLHWLFNRSFKLRAANKVEAPTLEVQHQAASSESEHLCIFVDPIRPQN